MKRFIQHAVLLAAVVPFAACDTFGSNNTDFLREQLTRAELRWDSTGSSDYTVLMTRRCDCGVAPTTVSLDVVANEIVAGTYIDTAEPLEEDEFGQFVTIDDMFALAHDALDRRAPVVLLEYNQEFGFIDDLVINYDQTRVDDDILIVVQDYIPAEP